MLKTPITATSQLLKFQKRGGRARTQQNKFWTADYLGPFTEKAYGGRQYSI